MWYLFCLFYPKYFFSFFLATGNIILTSHNNMDVKGQLIWLFTQLLDFLILQLLTYKGIYLLSII